MHVLLLLLFRNIPTVENLNDRTFFSFLHSPDRVSVVSLFERDCDACVASAPALEELSRMYWLEPRVRFGQIDCDRYSDVCNSAAVTDRPAWLVHLPAHPHARKYNRNADADVFARWLRQQTGISAPGLNGGLLYANATQARTLRQRMVCHFVVVDEPRLDASAALHRACRSLERRVQRGAKFAAVRRSDSAELSALLGDRAYCAFLVSDRHNAVPYSGPADEESVLAFLQAQKCRVVMSTPKPTAPPEPDYDEEI